MSEVAGEEQLWTKERWHARFSRAADPADTGYGHSSEEAAAFQVPDNTVLMDYHRAVLERTKCYLSSRIPESELKRESHSPTLNTINPVSRRLVGVINDSLQHVGQAAYVRGLLKGKGWLGR